MISMCRLLPHILITLKLSHISLHLGQHLIGLLNIRGLIDGKGAFPFLLFLLLDSGSIKPIDQLNICL